MIIAVALPHSTQKMLERLTLTLISFLNKLIY
jgi:hypothetical protein